MSRQPKAPSHGVALTPDVIERICERLAAGESLAKVCRDKDMPSKQAVFKRLATDEEFRGLYEAAKLLSADAHADRVLDEAEKATNSETAQVAKVRMAALQWTAEKLNPTKYGAKGNVEVGGGLVIEIVDPTRPHG